MIDALGDNPTPVEDGFPYEVETDSLADSLGLRIPVSYTHLRAHET